MLFLYETLFSHIFALSVLFCGQGGWEDDETVVEAACREALEEAGVKGILNVGSLLHPSISS